MKILSTVFQTANEWLVGGGTLGSESTVLLCGTVVPTLICLMLQQTWNNLKLNKKKKQYWKLLPPYVYFRSLRTMEPWNMHAVDQCVLWKATRKNTQGYWAGRRLQCLPMQLGTLNGYDIPRIHSQCDRVRASLWNRSLVLVYAVGV